MNDEQTKQMITSMLVENTGTHMLDSGGAYGRAWQQNQERDFKSEEPATILYEYGYLSFTHNLWHWLVERLDYDQTADEIFEAWATNHVNKDKSWFRCVDEFLEYLEAEVWVDEDAQDIHPVVTGLYGDGEPMTVNTYNHDGLLSQIIQYTYFEIEDSNILEDGIYIFIMVHGGCDARGGYGTPHLFSPGGMYCDESIFFDTDGTVFCNECGTTWHTDDSGNSWDSDKGQPLSQYSTTDISYMKSQSIADHVAIAHANLNQEIDNLNHIQQTMTVRHNHIYCPVCGGGLLLAG